MRTYRLTIAYDGTAYQGWQKQSNTDRTIQGILEKALSERMGFAVSIDGSGRTDAGVHALGQTASVRLPGAAAPDFFTVELNRMLPPDIRIRDACLMKNGFHARKSAVGKAYEYHIDTAAKPNVFTRRYCAHFPHPLDTDAMRRTAVLLTGTHEYAGYTDKKDDRSTLRTVSDIRITAQGSRIVIGYEGSGFLYHMVRILTGTLIEAGVRQRTPESAEEVLYTKDRKQAGFLAPAQGLFLREVYY